MKAGEKQKKLIETLNKIIADIENGYDGFLYLYMTPYAVTITKK